MKLMRKNGGFTLVELIVVIAILAILAGIAVPAYSGYINKANKAADLQLLGAVNSAFQAACLSKNTPPQSLEEEEAKITLSNGVVSTVTPYQEAFFDFYEGNKNTAFKFIKALRFNPATGCFEEADGQTVTLPGGGKVFVTNKQLEILKQSVLTKDTETVKTLMNQVDGVGTLVTGLLDSSEGLAAGVLSGYMTSADYLAASIKAMGGTVESSDPAVLAGQFGTVLNDYKTTLANQKMAAELNMDVEDFDPLALEEDDFNRYNAIKTEVGNEVNKNLLIMNVAQSASTQSKTDVMSIINSTDPKKGLIDAMSGTNGAAGMGQAALVYGAFTAYAMSDDATDEAKKALEESSKDGGDPTAVFDILKGEELTAFQTYMKDKNKGQKDLDACIEAMGVIDTTSQNQEAVSGLMENGFNNKDFVDALNGVLGNS